MITSLMQAQNDDVLFRESVHGYTNEFNFRPKLLCSLAHTTKREKAIDRDTTKFISRCQTDDASQRVQTCSCQVTPS